MRTTMLSAVRKPTLRTVAKPTATRKPTAGRKPTAKPTADIANHQIGQPFANPDAAGPHTPPATKAESTDPRPANVRRIVVAGRSYTEFDLFGMKAPELAEVCKSCKAEHKGGAYGKFTKVQRVAYIFANGDVNKVPTKAVAGKAPTMKDIKTTLKGAGKTGYSWMNAAQLREYVRTGIAPERPAPKALSAEWLRQLIRDAKADAQAKGDAARVADCKGFSGLKKAELVDKCAALGLLTDDQLAQLI